MKELTLRDIQHVLFDLTKEIHRFCVENDIQYTLAYGSLLGAIRHKGFIPWDDDIDIFMTRPNYEKFIKTFKSSNGCTLISPKESYICFSRVCDTDRTSLKSSIPWFSKEEYKDLGVWVDIFPIDGIDDPQNFKAVTDRINEIYQKQLGIRRAMPSISSKHTLKQKAKQLLRKLKYINQDIHKVNDSLQELCTQTSCEQATHFVQLACFDSRMNELYEKSLFDEYVDAEFEGATFKIIKEWDTMLKKMYGPNYMQPPPENQREQHSLDHNVFFWKNS